jgi:hypothetical protein
MSSRIPTPKFKDQATSPFPQHGIGWKIPLTIGIAGIGLVGGWKIKGWYDADQKRKLEATWKQGNETVKKETLKSKIPQRTFDYAERYHAPRHITGVEFDPHCYDHDD